MVIEDQSAFSNEEVQPITQEIAEFLDKYCEAETETFLLERENTEVELD